MSAIETVAGVEAIRLISGADSLITRVCGSLNTCTLLKISPSYITMVHVNIPSFSMIWAVAVLSTNCAKVPPMVITPVRSKVSVNSTLLSSMIVIWIEGCDKARGPSPPLKLTSVDTGL